MRVCDLIRVNLFSIAIAVATIGAGRANAQNIIIAPPEGFTVETAESRTQVGLVYRNQKIAFAMARFNASEIVFENPDRILAALPDLRDPERILQALSRWHPVNSERLCSDPGAFAACGFVASDDVAVIFNQSTLEAELFINPRYTYDRVPRGGFLPAPTIAPGLITSLSSRTAYDFDRSRVVGNHQMRAIAGRGRFAVRGEAFATTNGSGQFTALYATHSGEDRAWSAGLIPPQSNAGLARSRRIFGVRFGTKLETRLNQWALYATPLDISITQSATIEIQRDGQTLDIQNLRAGERMLDTSRLPPGSYEVDLIINEGGNRRRESRFFSTSTRLPPRGAPRWYVELGNAVPLRRPKDGFEDTDPVVLALGGRQRVGANLGISADGFFSHETSFVEIGGTYLSENTRMDVSALASDRGTLGASVGGNGRWERWSFNGGLRYLNTVAADQGFGAAVYAMFQRAFTQANISAVHSRDWGRFGVSGLFRRSDGGGESWYFGPFLDVTLRRADRWQLNLNARAEQSDVRQSAFLGVRLNRSLGKPAVRARQIDVSSRIDGNFSRSNDGTAESRETIAEVRAALNQDISSRSRLRLDGGARIRDGLGGFARGKLATPWFRGDVEGRHKYQNQTSALLNFSTGLALGGGGLFFSDSAEESGLTVQLRGIQNMPVSVQVDHQTRLITHAGKGGYIPIQSYALYDIGIQPSTPDDLAYDQSTERLIAYPGNVLNIKRTVQPVLIVVGRLVDREGLAISGLALRTTEDLGQTDPDGFYQIDVAIGQLVRAIQHGSEICAFTISSDVEPAAPYLDLGETVCD